MRDVPSLEDEAVFRFIAPRLELQAILRGGGRILRFWKCDTGAKDFQLVKPGEFLRTRRPRRGVHEVRHGIGVHVSESIDAKDADETQHKEAAQPATLMMSGKGHTASIVERD